MENYFSPNVEKMFEAKVETSTSREKTNYFIIHDAQVVLISIPYIVPLRLCIHNRAPRG